MMLLMMMLLMLQMVYSQLVCTEWDLRYIESLVRHIVPAIIGNKEELAKIGSIYLPTPPSDVGMSLLYCAVM